LLELAEFALRLTQTCPLAHRQRRLITRMRDSSGLAA
jgi:hypothetical protein